MTHTLLVPGDVPFVAANGNIAAYVHPDTLVLSISTDNPVRTAFALENAGVAQHDVASLNLNGASLLLRVVPLTANRIERIVAAVKTQQASCTYEPTLVDYATSTSAVPATGAVADVIAGY